MNIVSIVKFVRRAIVSSLKLRQTTKLRFFSLNSGKYSLRNYIRANYLELQSPSSIQNDWFSSNKPEAKHTSRLQKYRDKESEIEFFLDRVFFKIKIIPTILVVEMVQINR